MSTARDRYLTAWHEAAHAAAAFAVDRAVERVEIVAPTANHLEGGELGICRTAPFTITTVHEALDDVLIDFAGEATVVAAFHLGLLDDDLMRLAEAAAPNPSTAAKDAGDTPSPPVPELTAEELLAMPHGADAVHRAAYLGVRGCDTKDAKQARDTARSWTASEVGALAFLDYSRHRTIELVRTGEFIAMARKVAMALLEFDVLEGPQAYQLCERASVLHRTREETQR